MLSHVVQTRGSVTLPATPSAEPALVIEHREALILGRYQRGRRQQEFAGYRARTLGSVSLDQVRPACWRALRSR